MLLFHRYSLQHIDDLSFRVSFHQKNTQAIINRTMNILRERYRDFLETIDASDMLQSALFRKAFGQLYQDARAEFLRIIACEFTDAYRTGIEMERMRRIYPQKLRAWQARNERHLPPGDMMYFQTRLEETPLAETATRLLTEQYDGLQEVIPAIRKRGRAAGGQIRA